MIGNQDTSTASPSRATPPNNQDTRSTEPSGNGLRTLLRELLHIALIAAFVVLPIRIFVAQPFIVSGSSMDPTFENGDYLIVDQISYRINDPVRGQIVIFRFPNDTTKFFIKRIIGLPGETVRINDGETTIINNANPEGFVLNEPYISSRSDTTIDVTLEEDEYFVMGDNRNASSDSRSWGPLDRDFIVGKAFIRLLPVDHASLYPGTYQQVNVR